MGFTKSGKGKIRKITAGTKTAKQMKESIEEIPLNQYCNWCWVDMKLGDHKASCPLSNHSH